MPSQRENAVIVDILEEHLEELGALWARRALAIDSADYLPHEVADIEERMEAHTQGVLIGGDAAVPIIEDALESDDPSDVAAAVFLLLRIGTGDCVDSLVHRLVGLTAKHHRGFCDGLQCGPIDALHILHDFLKYDSTLIVSLATEVLAHHGKMGDQHVELRSFLEHDDPVVRQSGWRILALIQRSN